jgi:hypothetical protein
MLVVIGSVGASALTGAARADVPAAESPAAPQQTEKAASEAGGIVQLIDKALGSVDLRPEQKSAIKAMASDVDSKVAAADQAKRDLLLALADQIAAGKVNATALHDQNERFAAQMARRRLSTRPSRSCTTSATRSSASSS